MSPLTTSPTVAQASLGKSIVIGCLLGVVVSLVGVGGGMLAAGNDWASSLGLGLFAAFWGGLGFGTMLGGVVYATRLEAVEAAQVAGDAEASAVRSSEATPAPDRDAV